jgi:hypothetical protein
METTFRKMKKLTSFEEYLNIQYEKKGNSKKKLRMIL